MCLDCGRGRVPVPPSRYRPDLGRGSRPFWNGGFLPPGPFLEDEKKSRLYRSFGNLDKDIRRHELVAVEYGTNLEAVTDALIHAVSDDLAGTPEYASYKTAAFAPVPVKEFRRVRRYDYEMTGIVYPPYADKNILIDYGIIEESELEK